LRIPISEPAARRVENRVVGADANPYLSIAASLAAGYIGLAEKIKPRAEVSDDSYAHARELPYGLLEAIDEFKRSTPLREVLGSGFCDLYSAVKQHEFEEFMRVISPWEREHLLLNV